MRISSYLAAVVSFLSLLCAPLQSQETPAKEQSPLRVFIRGGAKSHGPADNGIHDYPNFVKEWTTLLNARGAKAEGALQFPNAEQLAQTDVLVLFADNAGNIKPEERVELEKFTKRGGGIVVLHDAICGHDPEWFADLVGGAWEHGKAKWFEGPMNVYFTPDSRKHPVTQGMSNWDADDEIYYNLTLRPEAQVLSVSWTPELKDKTRTASELHIYATSPQIWSYEKDNYRAFVSLPGHKHATFQKPHYKGLILRAISWAGKRPNVNEFLQKEELDSLLYPEGGPKTPGDSQKTFDLHPDFEISLVAAEPLINKPINVDWDARGRLWVVETPTYPGLNEELSQPDPETVDSISILEDKNGDGVMDHKTIFATDLHLATSFVFHEDGVIVSQAPEILFFRDTDGDGKADVRTVLYKGLGQGDSHAVINNLRWGHDGWIYATHGYSAGDVTNADGTQAFGRIGSGVVRFRADGSAIEQFSSKGGNTWGLDITSRGEQIWSQPTSGDLILQSIVPESILSKGKVDKTASFSVISRSPKSEPAMTWEVQAYRQIDFVGSFTAAAGAAVYEGGAWPQEWTNAFFTTEPTINLVHHQALTPDGVTYTSAKTRPGEFLRSTDLWFRPVENRVGPDGALYVLDFYNQAAIHNDTRGPKHGPRNAAVRPDRDHYFGRIWKIQHKKATPIEPVVLDPENVASLEAGLKHPNRHIQDNARRLLKESGRQPESIPSAPAATPEAAKLAQFLKLAENGAEPGDVTALVESFTSLTEDWSRSAVIAALSSQPSLAIKQALSTERSEEQVQSLRVLVTSLNQALAKQPDQIPDLIKAVAEAPASSLPLQIQTLQSIASLAANLDAKALPKEALQSLLKSNRDGLLTATLPLAKIAQIDVTEILKGLAATLSKADKSVEERLGVARSILSSGLFEQEQAAFSSFLGDQKVPLPARREVIQSIGTSQSKPVSDFLLALYPQVQPELKGDVLNEILRTPERALALIDKLASDRSPASPFASILQPGNFHLLRTHTNPQVSEKAKALWKEIRGSSDEAKDAIIARLLPQVSQQPANLEQGKLYFAATCAVCHAYQGEGKEIGPRLDGMGAHGLQTLLVHVLDPNREVDPSYSTWQATDKNNASTSGILIRENAQSVVLRNQAGDFEFQRQDLSKLENTGLSFMPEGFDGLPVEFLRDLFAYMMASDSNYRFINLQGIATADSRKGIYAGPELDHGGIDLAKFGIVDVHGIPFDILDPSKSDSGRNIIQLKGGGGNVIATTFPKEVTIPMGYAASRIHILGGVAGWGFPFNEGQEAMQLTVHYHKGEPETHTFINGREFADYIRVVEVPGSKLAPGLAKRGQQIRYFAVNLKGSGPIEKITLASPGNQVAPTLISLTAQLKPTENDAKAEPQASKPSPAVLLFGGGSSHDFNRWFNEFDVELLKKSGHDVGYTSQPQEFEALLPDAKTVILSTNQALPSLKLRKLLFDHLKKNKGLYLLHAGLWYNWNDWNEYNVKIAGGGSRAHDRLGDFKVTLTEAGKKHPILKGVPESFVIFDELYHFEPAPGSKLEVLATAHSQVTGKDHPILWITQNPELGEGRVFSNTLGHDGKAHENPHFQAILKQGLEWVSGKN